MIENRFGDYVYRFIEMEKIDKKEILEKLLMWLAAGLVYSSILFYAATFLFMGGGHGSEEPQRLLFTRFRIFPFWWAGVFGLFSIVRFRLPAIILSVILILNWIFTILPDGLTRIRDVASLDFGMPFLVLVFLHTFLTVMFFGRCLLTLFRRKPN